MGSRLGEGDVVPVDFGQGDVVPDDVGDVTTNVADKENGVNVWWEVYRQAMEEMMRYFYGVRRGRARPRADL
jgi:hypothetical protein